MTRRKSGAELAAQVFARRAAGEINRKTYEDEMEAMRRKTARLRELRLAKEAAERRRGE